MTDSTHFARTHSLDTFCAYSLNWHIFGTMTDSTHFVRTHLLRNILRVLTHSTHFVCTQPFHYTLDKDHIFWSTQPKNVILTKSAEIESGDVALKIISTIECLHNEISCTYQKWSTISETRIKTKYFVRPSFSFLYFFTYPWVSKKIDDQRRESAVQRQKSYCF